MTKYDFEINLGINTSTGMILNKISSGATVLEFGCAAGRMTRYMKNALDCRVYIVEYDREAFETAMQYAVDGVCDDILTLSWMERFKEIEFDVILFADVLEHLPRPETALSNAAKLLNKQGKIYISIPNIAHNDVLLKAFHNHFDYTDVGLLDNTHVHFWGYENIIAFAENSGLYVHSIEATYLPTGKSEQFAEKPFSCPPILLNYFNERKFAEAYQFVIELGREKGDNYNKERLLSYKKNSVTSHIYIDDGEGFRADNVIAFESENTTPGRYVVHYVLDNVQKVRKLRFDPLEYQGCIIQNLSIRQAGKGLGYIYSDYLKFSEGIMMLGTDPMIFVELADHSDPVVIDADIIIYGEEYLELVQQACADKYTEAQNLSQKLNGFMEENGRLQGELGGFHAENARLQGETVCLGTANARMQGEIADLNTQNGRLQGEVDRINAENSAFQREIGGYIHLVNEKDKLLLKKERQLSEKNSLLAERDNSISEKNSLLAERDNSISEKNSLLAEKDNLLLEKDNLLLEKDSLLTEKDSYIIELENKVDYYKNRKCIKLFDRFWKTYWAIRLKLRRLIGKKEDA